MEEKVKAKWVSILKFINYLLENIGNRSHSLALQQLREKYGGSKGMSKSDKKEAGFDWKEAGVDTSKTDEVDLACQMQSWRAFVSEGPTM